MRSSLLVSIFITVTAASTPASAQLYKWIDVRGVTNYSNTPPAAANKVTLVDSTLSVYTPDAKLLDAVKAMHQRVIQTSTEPEPQRAPVARIASPPYGYEQCMGSGRLGCDDLYPVHYPAYLPVAAYGRHGGQPTRFLAPPRAVAADQSRVSRGSQR